jgi:hypothetical protein
MQMGLKRGQLIVIAQYDFKNDGRVVLLKIIGRLRITKPEMASTALAVPVLVESGSDCDDPKSQVIKPSNRCPNPRLADVVCCST